MGNKEFDHISIIDGSINSNRVFIVDENNNKDLTDDPIRDYMEFNWDATGDLIKCFNHLANEDSSWIKIGISNNIRRFSINEHRTADILIGAKEYRIGINEAMRGDFTYGSNTELALLGENGSYVEDLLMTDILKMGEYIKLDDQYYKFEKIFHDSKYLTLVKEHNFKDQIGTQVGMIAPEFKCVTTLGDTLSNSNLSDRMMVIANSCGCGGDKLSTKAFYEIQQEFGEQAHVIRFDSNIKDGLDGNQVDMIIEFNRVAYEKFRGMYCSRICYVVNENNRILDKFEVTEREQFLPKYL